MTEEHLRDVAMLTIESEITKNLKFDDVKTLILKLLFSMEVNSTNVCLFVLLNYYWEVWLKATN